MPLLLHYGLTVLAAAATEPVTRDEAKSHLRVTTSADDTVIDGFIIAAREYLEAQTKRQLITATWELSLDQFPAKRPDAYAPQGWRYGTLEIPLAPVTTVNYVKYIDVDGVLQTLDVAEYQTSFRREPARVAPARFKVWPVTDPQSLDAVRVSFVAGFGNMAAVPEKYKIAIKMLVGHLYENREVAIDVALQEIPVGLKSFIRTCKWEPYR
jgi:uncharacterized phiE125 gp8 family phage protein